MRKRFRPSPALVISMLALFAALGGTVYAAGKINGKTIKAKSLPGNRIVPDTVTGTQVKESSLKKVPVAEKAEKANTAEAAFNATAANTAVTAQNADKVNGHSAGCRAGTQLFAGSCWESAPRPKAVALSAATICDSAGGTLPRAYDLAAFSKVATLGATYEWSGDLNEVKEPFNTSVGVIVSSAGEIKVDGVTDEKEFRCVFPLVR